MFKKIRKFKNVEPFKKNKKKANKNNCKKIYQVEKNMHRYFMRKIIREINAEENDKIVKAFCEKFSIQDVKFKENYL